MRGGIRIGSISGIPLYIDVSWFLILGFLAVWLSGAYSRFSPNFALGYGAITAILFFLSIAMTRIAHALMSKAQGVNINSINLQFMGGGNNSLEQEPKTPLSMFGIAIAAPLTSLVLSIIGFTAAWLIAGDVAFSSSPKAIEALPDSIGNLRTIWTLIALNFARINFIFFVFSLIPALPFEGGTMLKAAIWKVTGDRLAGIRWAARSGQTFGILVMLLGGFIALTNLSGLFLIFFGWFLFGNAGSYLYINNLQQALLNITAEFAMTRDFRLVDADLSLREFADKFLLMEDKDANPIYIASANGRDRGVISGVVIRNIDSKEWSSQTVQSLANPLDEVDTVELKTKLADVINLLEEKQLKYLIVRSPVGSVAGVIDHGDIIKALDSHLLWRIPSEYIKQIKSDGKFPPNFRLSELCKQLADTDTAK
jgi:Zn-dependent protease/CBS domain-containing protein